jgi:4-hydroxybenzoate polyprenyltransferase
MAIARVVVLLLLVAAAVLFALYAGTGREHYKRQGVVIVKWTVIAGLVFFAGMIFERML